MPRTPQRAKRPLFLESHSDSAKAFQLVAEAASQALFPSILRLMITICPYTAHTIPHLGQRHPARSAPTRPKVKQDVFPLKIRKTVNAALQIIQLSIRHLFSCTYDFRRGTTWYECFYRSACALHYQASFHTIQSPLFCKEALNITHGLQPNLPIHLSKPHRQATASSKEWYWQL